MVQGVIVGVSIVRRHYVTATILSNWLKSGPRISVSSWFCFIGRGRLCKYTKPPIRKSERTQSHKMIFRRTNICITYSIKPNVKVSAKTHAYFGYLKYENYNIWQKSFISWEFCHGFTLLRRAPITKQSQQFGTSIRAGGQEKLLSNSDNSHQTETWQLKDVTK